MSRRDSASQPVSRASSRSPRTASLTSAAAPASAAPTQSAAQGELLPYNPVRDTPRIYSGNGGEPATSQHQQRSLAFNAILNPDSHTESSITSPGTRLPDPDPWPAPSGHSRVVSGPPSIPRLQHHDESTPYSYYQRQHPPFGGVTPTASPRADKRRLTVPGRERASPTAVSPLPALNNPRAGLSPQPSTIQSAHNPLPRGAATLHASPAIPSIAGRKRRYDSDIRQGTPTPLTQLGGATYSGPPPPNPMVLPSTTAASLATPTRSFSQPVTPQQLHHHHHHHHHNHQYGNVGPQRHQPEGVQGSWAWPQQQQPPGQLQPAWDPHRPVALGSAYGVAPPLPIVRDPLLEPASAVPPRGGAATRSGRGRGASKAARALGTTPSVQLGTHDPLFIVEIDTTTGSKEQDEKRQRNAEASARFRNRKKDEHKRGEHRVSQLEEEKRNLEMQLQNLQQACDSHKWQVDALKQALEFYKRDRNRLRDVVSRTPGISEAARGPPSPQLTAAMVHGGAISDPAPPPSTQAAAQAGYISSEASSGERPARRRRTHQSSEGSVSYAQQPQSQGPFQQHEPLPSFSMNPYAMAPSRPASASSAEILPPLRSVEGGRPETCAPSGQPQYHTTRATYETGFIHAVKREPEDERGQR